MNFITRYVHYIFLLLIFFSTGCSEEKYDFEKNGELIRAEENLKKGIEKKKSLETIKKLSDGGLDNATMTLARIYLNGKYTKINQKTAFKLCSKVAKKGNIQAILLIGTMFENGEGVKSDIESALLHYRKAAEMGDSSAMTRLADLGYKKNTKESIKLYERAIELNNSGAMYNLAVRYQNGDGVLKNPNKAIQLLKNASNQGLKEADLFIAQLYLYGKNKNIPEAIKILHDLSNNEIPKAQFLLATVYCTGEGVGKDLEKCKYYAEKADQNGFDVKRLWDVYKLWNY